MKRIMFVAAPLAGGGAERVMVNLATEMVAQGHEVIIIITSPKPIEYQADSRVNLITIKTDYPNKVKKIFEKTKQLRQIFREHPDYTLITFLPDVCVYTAVASLGLPNKSIMSERNAPKFNPDYAWQRKLRDIAYHFADTCVFQTQEARDYFCKSIRRKGVIIENPIAVDSLPDSWQEEREKEILMVGRLEPQKNVGMFIEAMELLKKEHPDYCGRIYGRGHTKDEMSRMIREKHLEDYVYLEDYSTNIYEKMRRATAYVSTSNYEGMCNSMLEAMAMGVPTVVTDCPSGGAKAVINHKENGILIPVGDYRKLHEELKQLIEEPAMAERLGQNAAKIKEQLSVARIVEKWLQVI